MCVSLLVFFFYHSCLDIATIIDWNQQKKKEEEDGGGGGGGGGGRREGRGGLSRYCWCGCVIVLDWLASKWDRLLHGWHDDGGFGVRHVALAPHLGHSLQLSVEVDALWEWSKWRQLLLARMGDLHGAIVKKNQTRPNKTYRFAVEVHVASEGSARSGEGEHGQRHWDGHVDSDLSDVDVLDEFPGGGAVGGEDGGSVAVTVVVDQLDGVIQRVHAEDHQDGAKDLFAVALHRSLSKIIQTAIINRSVFAMWIGIAPFLSASCADLSQPETWGGGERDPAGAILIYGSEGGREEEEEEEGKE